MKKINVNVKAKDIRVYDIEDKEKVAIFLKVNEENGCFSNMSGKYPLEVNGIPIRTSEALYQCFRFTDYPEIQKEIIAEKSPIGAKMKSKKYKDKTRKDWMQNRISFMRWCLQLKLIQNWNTFSPILEKSEGKNIIELSSKGDAYWGTIPFGEYALVGVNALGRLIMELRNDFFSRPEIFNTLEPLNVDNFKLYGKEIELIYK